MPGVPMRLTSATVLCLTLMLIAGCSASGSECAWVKTIQADPADTMATKRQVLDHNDKVNEFCRSR